MNLIAKYIRLVAPRKIRFFTENINLTRLSPNEVIIKTIYSAISPGTEIGAYLGAQSLKPGKAYPRLVGYCNVGKIIKIGKKIRQFKVGDFVLTNQSHRSLYKIPAKEIILKLPKGLNLKLAGLIYLYNIGLVSLENGNFKPSNTTAVIGLGALGLNIIEQAARAKSKVIAISNSRNKLKLAKNLGAKISINKKRVQPEQADLVITTSNFWLDWELALQITKMGGTIVVVGFPGRNEKTPKFNPLDPQYFYVKKLKIVSVGYPEKMRNPELLRAAIKKNCRKIINLVLQKRLHPEKLISGIYPWHKIESAYKALIKNYSENITFLLKW